MRVVVGPVSSRSAREWLAHARHVVDQLEVVAPGECFTAPEVRSAFDGYLREWSSAAVSGEPFLWERDLPAEEVEYHLHAFHQLAAKLQQDGRRGLPEGPPEGREFYAAVLRGALSALEAENPSSAAFARHLGEFWPREEISIR